MLSVTTQGGFQIDSCWTELHGPLDRTRGKVSMMVPSMLNMMMHGHMAMYGYTVESYDHIWAYCMII